MNVYLKESTIKDAGQGLFATKDIKKDEVVMTNPGLSVTGIAESVLEEYVYDGVYPYHSSLCVGLGSYFNHDSGDPNIEYDYDEDEQREYPHLVFTFSALRDIKKDEELFISYDDEMDWEEG